MISVVVEPPPDIKSGKAMYWQTVLNVSFSDKYGTIPKKPAAAKTAADKRKALITPHIVLFS